MMEGRSAMNIEIHKPELERRVLDGIQSGRFHDVDELLTKALDALSEKEASRPYSGAALVAAMQASPISRWSSFLSVPSPSLKSDLASNGWPSPIAGPN